MPEYNLGTVKGADGKGIQSIVKTGTSGLVDTYTITYTNGDTQTYTVTNGKDGEGGADIVTEWEQTLSDEKIPSEKLTKNTIDTKVTGTKVTSWSGTVSDSNVPSEKLVKDSLDGKVNTSDVVNNLTTTTAGKVLDARQGKALADLIGDAITYINL